MIHAATFLLGLSGFTLLLLAMPKHQQDWLGRKLAKPQAKALRMAGFAAIVGAFFASGAGFGWAYGSVSWFGWLTFAALLVVTVNCNRDALKRRFGKGG